MNEIASVFEAISSICAHVTIVNNLLLIGPSGVRPRIPANDTAMPWSRNVYLGLIKGAHILNFEQTRRIWSVANVSHEFKT